MSYDSRPDTYAHIAIVRDYLNRASMELLLRGHEHDLSKLVDPELATFNEYTPKLENSTYGSDEYKSFLEGMGEGLKHHYRHNRHHPQHFPNGIAGMNLLDLVEMLCDWKAATLRHADGNLARSIDQNAERFGYGDEIKRLLINTARDLGLFEGFEDDDLLGPNYGRGALGDDDSIHVLAPGEYNTTLCGQSVDDIPNACSMDSGYKPDEGSGCWTCLQESNHWAKASA